MKNRNQVYTIGHSTHSMECFTGLLKRYAIDVIVDVRSVPYSRYAEQFNQDELSRALAEQSIYYLYMGDSLGARHEEEELLFADGTVDFEKVQKTMKFQDGIVRILGGVVKGYRVAIMCSEKNPLECHRFSMISRNLAKKGIRVVHILPDRAYSHEELENRLFAFYSVSGRVEVRLKKLPSGGAMQQSLFSLKTIDDLYRDLNHLVGYGPEKKGEAVA